MSSRRLGYVIVLILLAIGLTAPQVAFFSVLAFEAYHIGRIPPLIPGWGPVIRATPFILTQGEVWSGRIFWTGRQTHDQAWAFNGVDPRTGTPDTAFTSFTLQNPRLMPFGDRMWIVDTRPGQADVAFEIADGKIQPESLTFPLGLPLPEQRFLLEDEPALIRQNREDVYEISTIKAGAWVHRFNLVLPDLERDWPFGTTQVNFSRVSSLKCFNHNGRTHLFVDVDGLVLHREGLILEAAAASDQAAAGENSTTDDSASKPISEPPSHEIDRGISGWSLVTDGEQLAKVSDQPLPTQKLHSVALVNGQPVAVFVLDAVLGHQVGYFVKYDGSRWSPLATQKFVFGNYVRTVPGRDGRTSSVVASTPLGKTYVYEVGSAGVRLVTSELPTTHIRHDSPARIFDMLTKTLMFFVSTSFGLGIFSWLLMCRYTTPGYQFQNQAVELANLRQRGFARLIDLIVVIGVAFVFGRWMLRDFDWDKFWEATNLHVDHPTVQTATQVAVLIGVWFVVYGIMHAVLQGRYGITPGKFCCGIRTCRTDLKPCGLARSVAREVVLSVDSGNLLCWTPGILSIAFTKARQRLGDLVADTIVVRSGSFSDCSKVKKVGSVSC